MEHKRTVAIGSILVAVVGALVLLALTLAIGQQRHDRLVLYFVYQGAALAVAVATIALIRLIKRGRLSYMTIGRLDAPGRAIPLLGVRHGERWVVTGAIFAIIVCAATSVFLYFGRSGGLPSSELSWAKAAFVAVPLAISNAFVEETVTRWTFAEGMMGGLARFAPWASAITFGAVHYFGIPGGPLGVLMAGFLGWLLTRAIQDTAGIGWAVLIHFCLDLLIFTVTLAPLV